MVCVIVWLEDDEGLCRRSKWGMKKILLFFRGFYVASFSVLDQGTLGVFDKTSRKEQNHNAYSWHNTICLKF